MNKKLLAACALGLTAVFGLAGCVKPVTEVPELSADVTQSVKSHFQVHSIGQNTLPEGYTIPWISSKTGAEDWGNAVATGALGQNDCNIFNVSRINGDGKYNVRLDTQMEICP